MKCGALKENIWRCRLREEDVAKLRIKNVFWEDVLKAWASFNYYTGFKIENQILWYNSDICVGGKPVLWKDMLEKGLIFVEQLFKQERFKTEEEMKEEFGLTTLRYNSLKSAIPSEWKTFFCSTPKSVYYPLAPHNYDSCLESWVGFSQRVYRSLSDDVLLIHNKFLKWKMDLGIDFCDGICDFGIRHLDIYRVTNVTKYRSFQYRLLQRALVSNIELAKWKMIDSDLCSFCNQDRETIVHLLCECSVVLELWGEFKKYVKDKFEPKEVKLSPVSIIFNNVVEGKKNVINFLCLLTKQFIYARRCMKQPLHFVALCNIFRKVERMEKYIAVKNNQV